MKIEIGSERPENFVEYWEGQYEVFSHLEFACGIPSILFAITTLKENRKPNVCFNAWSSFAGGADGYYAIMAGISRNSHTYANILREKEFVINFISREYYDSCIKTIENNKYEDDEIKAGGFTPEKAATTSCPRLGEAFLSLECRFDKEACFGENESLVLLAGKIVHIAAQEEFSRGIDAKYGDDGFMMNIHAPKNLTTGEGKPSAIATCKIVRINEGG